MERRIEYEEAFPSLHNSYSITLHYSTDYLRLYGNGGNDVEKEVLSREEVQNEVPDSEKLYRYKCSLCHELPDIDAYSSYEHWINVMNARHEPGRYNESVNAEDDALIKDYLRIMTQK